MAVEDFVFQEDHRIGIADRGLEQALGVGGGRGRDHLQAGNVREPGRIILAVLGGDARGGAVRPAEHDRAAHLAARHIKRLGRRIDQLVHRLHGEIEGHELDDRLQAGERRADAQAGKAVLGDRRVDHALVAELLQQSLRDLVGALIFGDLLAHHEHVLVAPHLLGHGVAQRFAHGHGDHLGAFGNVGIGGGVRGRRLGSAAFGAGFVSDLASDFSAFAAGAGFRLRRRLAVLDRRFVLAVAQDHRDRRVHRHVGGAFRHQNFSERALVRRLHFHGGLVGFDLGDDVARLDAVALLLEPLGEVALFHRGRQRGHEHFDRHGRYFFTFLRMILSENRFPLFGIMRVSNDKCRYKARTRPAPDRGWRIPPPD